MQGDGPLELVGEPGQGLVRGEVPVATACRPPLPSRGCEEGGGVSWAVGQRPIELTPRMGERATQRSEDVMEWWPA